MTEFSKQVENSCRSHAQGRELSLFIVVTSTPMLGRENEIKYYRTDPVKHDLKISPSPMPYMYCSDRILTTSNTLSS
ncbi:unnamed protein product [Lasius platythorax]|uniref:Uncharacterized protein n=1 Tax=Lasius platythorax TaxID=488582 RepID=A0AAV2NVA9_9HYME